MFCNNCGNQMPEGTVFCPACGAPAQQPQQAYYQQPQAPAPAPVKKNATPIMITFIISIVLIIASILAPMVTPFFDVPVVSFVMEMADEDVDVKEMEDDLDETLDRAKEQYELIEDELSSKEKKQYKNLLDKMEKMVDNCSLLNINAAAKAQEAMPEEYQPDGMDDDMEAFETAVGIVVGASIGAFVLPLLFALLGGLKKSAGLTVAALIFTAISQAVLSGTLLLILSAVIYIVQIVLCSKYKKA